MPTAATVTAWFVQQVERAPTCTSIEYADCTKLSYHELLCAAAESAQRLTAEVAVLQETLVAILAERGLHLLVGVFATLLSGAAFVPFDPTYPRQRLQWMCEDVEPSGILVCCQHRVENWLTHV